MNEFKRSWITRFINILLALFISVALIKVVSGEYRLLLSAIVIGADLKVLIENSTFRKYVVADGKIYMNGLTHSRKYDLKYIDNILIETKETRGRSNVSRFTTTSLVIGGVKVSINSDYVNSENKSIIEVLNKQHKIKIVVIN